VPHSYTELPNRFRARQRDVSEVLRRAPSPYANSGRPQAPAAEYRHWYQWYFHTERGRAGLAANRGPLCRLLWDDFLGISCETLYSWKISYPEFRESITRGKIEADARVAEALYHRACGYSHPAVKIFMPAGASEPVYAPYTEHYPPDANAALRWLMNRQPERWRDRRNMDHTGSVT